MIEYIYSAKFENGGYSDDPAADPERFDAIANIFSPANTPRAKKFIEAEPASKEDILLAHTESHYEDIRRSDYLFNMASLAAGGAITAARIALDGTPAFAAIRPPGHHASGADAWGFCFFNNMAIAILKLMHEEKIKSAFILDFDLHFGDGTKNILGWNRNVEYFHPDTIDRDMYMDLVRETFSIERSFDILGVSAGFDQYINDWGRKLGTVDFETIGSLAKDFAMANCKGRRFAVLEGGYNFQDLGKNILAFCKGFE